VKAAQYISACESAKSNDATCSILELLSLAEVTHELRR